MKKSLIITSCGSSELFFYLPVLEAFWQTLVLEVTLGPYLTPKGFPPCNTPPNSQWLLDHCCCHLFKQSGFRNWEVFSCSIPNKFVPSLDWNSWDKHTYEPNSVHAWSQTAGYVLLLFSTPFMPISLANFSSPWISNNSPNMKDVKHSFFTNKTNLLTY